MATKTIEKPSTKAMVFTMTRRRRTAASPVETPSASSLSDAPETNEM